MTQLFSNNAYGILTGTVNPESTSIALSAGDSAKFPVPTDGDFFLVTIVGLNENSQEALWEIVKVTNNVGDVFAVERGQENTVPLQWLSGTRLELRVTADTLSSKQDQIQEDFVKIDTPNAIGKAKVINDSDTHAPFEAQQLGDGPLAKFYRAASSASTHGTGVTFTNNGSIEADGSVNGRDVAVDGITLDGLDSTAMVWNMARELPAELLTKYAYLTAGNQTGLMPENPEESSLIAFADIDNDWSIANALTLDGNGNVFAQGGDSEYILDLKGAMAQFSFLNGQWELINFSRLSDAYGVELGNYLLKGVAISELTNDVPYASENLVNSKPNENLLINGDRLINQRVFAGGQPAANVYGADRWKGDTLGTRIEQVVENTKTLSGSYVISWVGGTGTADVDGQTGLNSGDSVTMTATGNYSVIVPTDATKIKFEKGSSKTPYQARPIAEELLLCQRYFQKSFAPDFTPANGPNGTSFANLDGAVAFTSSNVGFAADTIIFKTTMRGTPALTRYGNSSGYGSFANPTTGVVTWLSNSVIIGSASPTRFTAQQQVVNGVYGQGFFHWTADAEIY